MGPSGGGDAVDRLLRDSSIFDRRCRGEWWRPISMALEKLPRDAFDYVWLLQPPRYDPALVRGMTPVWRDGSSVLFRIDDRRPPAISPPA